MLLRKILDSIIGRILELKQEMVNLDVSEYHYIDDVLSDLKITPTDAQITIPRYYVQDAWKVIQDRAAFLSTIRTNFEGEAKEEPSNPHYITTVTGPTKMAKRIEGLRRIAQAMNAQEYEQALVAIKEKIRQNEGVEMQDRMQEQIRQWFLECRDATGKFPDYPSEEAGGSLWVFKQKPPEMLAAEEAARDEPEGWMIAPSVFLEDLRSGCNEYEQLWKYRDESNNFFQRHEEELIEADKRAELDLEIRVHVDELMRQELRNLKIAIDKEKQKRIPKKKPKKQKGKKKGKKGKDLTPDRRRTIELHQIFRRTLGLSTVYSSFFRTLESLYEELVMEDIIKRVEKVSLADYYGEYSYLGCTLRANQIEPQPSLSDVKQLVTLYSILPLGESKKPRKVLFYSVKPYLEKLISLPINCEFGIIPTVNWT
ncbi:unnamed protein product [Dibothriocephalus latus]|uniref:Uncharacterized protein n=1 Tax=Dibothriocephalus latus TaxID=60516 RepID=A0A3P6TUI0_DIBLA|nr:unnamed protein product [Dibothriocephalus latus]